MGIIYFDRDKRAYAFPIADCMATTDSKTWEPYAEKTCGVDWDIINGEFTPLKTTLQMQIEEQKAAKRAERNAALNEADHLANKTYDEYFIADSDEQWAAQGPSVKYRRYLRDFTKRDNWWTAKIPTFEQFVEEFGGQWG
jgi:hypothetical protein